MVAMSSSLSQLSCFSHLRGCRSSSLSPILRFSKLTIRMSLDGHGTETSRTQSKTNVSYTSDASRSYIQQTVKPQPASEDHLAGNIALVEEAQEPIAIQKKRAAKIHDFCFGIPFGGLVLSGGLLGFMFSRNLATLSTLLYGGALLALSTFSLKIWRQGKSSLPFILGQAVLSGALFWKNMQSYSLVCCHAVLLLICDNFWRKSTTEEVENICNRTSMMKTCK
ncbi:TMEM14 family, partial [Dillenia turbinata]